MSENLIDIVAEALDDGCERAASLREAAADVTARPLKELRETVTSHPFTTLGVIAALTGAALAAILLIRRG